MIVYKCDLCGEIRDCSQKEIEGTEYDICPECWEGLTAKLKGKGRAEGRRETALAPPLVTVPEIPREAKQPFPGQPPEIIAESKRAN
jgi:hypothetical protein